MFSSKIKSKIKILDFDIECRPLSWYGGDFVTKEITAIACKFIDSDDDVSCWLLGENSPEEMVLGFLEFYNEAGIVTGHYIRGYDLPIINSSLTELGFKPLHSKLTHDTKLDLIKRQGMSNSQENLASMLNVKKDKIGMTQEDWRQANRLTEDGLQRTKRRVIGDVLQHIEMRERLIENDMLSKPKVWSSYGNNKTKYHS